MIHLVKQHIFFKDKTITSCTCLEHQGYCNENYLVTTKKKKYIVRKLLRDDINRAFEWKIHHLAYKQGITAEPLIFDEKHGLMIFEFLDGAHKSKLDKHDLKLLAGTLRKLHSIKLESTPIHIAIENQAEEVQKAFEIIAKYPKDHVFCHNDLNPKNILFSDTLKLIDWEYAGVNDRYFDLASVSVEFNLSSKENKILLQFYFEEEIYFEDKLEAYKTIYIALCKQWFNTLGMNHKD